jgi:uncharacterized membrane protein YcaP (DUF421 family)
MSEKELAFEARQEGIDVDRFDEIGSAHVEANGALSVLRAAWARAVPRRDAEQVRERARP